MIIALSKRVSFIVAAMCLTFLCGCVEVDLDLTLAKDGSGSIALKYSVSDQTIDRVKAAERIESELAKARGVKIPPEVRNHPSRLFMTPTEDGYRSLLEPYKKDGIEIVSLSVEARSARQYVDLEVSFRDVASLQKLSFFEEYGFSLTKTPGGKYEILRQGALPATVQTKKKSEPRDKGVDELMRDFDVTIRFDSPTRIDRSSSARQTSYVAEWRFDVSKDPDALKKLRQQDFRVVFFGDDVTINEVKRQQSKEEDDDAKVSDKPEGY